MGLFDFLKKESNNQENIIDNNQNNNVVSYGKINCNKIDLNFEVANKLQQKYIAFDIETTGLDPINDRIVEIGAVLFENRIPVSNFGTLIKSDKKISADATKVNNISNDMISNAPLEIAVYPKFVEFLGEALSGNVIICAHNAQFDISFLKNTLERLGFNGSISYIDTLYISRSILQLDNYKQSTIANFFGIINKEAHRAISDAEVCGNILSKLLDYDIPEKKTIRNEIKIELIPLDDYEIKVYSYIFNLINKSNLDTNLLGAIKKKDGFVDIYCSNRFIRYKFAKTGKYLIIPTKYLTGCSIPSEPCSVSEGGIDYSRVYFKGYNDLDLIKDFIIEEYQKALEDYKDFLKYYPDREEEMLNYIHNMFNIDSNQVLDILNNELREKSLDNYLVKQTIEKRILRNDIEINAINDRVPLNEIKNLNDWEKGFDAGNKYWIKGDELRKSGNYYEAIQQFDKARYNGYLALVLYESYAMAYHQLKDYDNEIEILEEGIKRLESDGQNTSELVARRDKAIQTKGKIKEKENAEYLKQQERIEKEEQKRITLEQKQIQEKLRVEDAKLREEKRINNQNIPLNARVIVQLDDNHNIVNKYPSIAEAVRQTGINSKSIRDAANGVQKHAGGYVWEYAEEEK